MVYSKRWMVIRPSFFSLSSFTMIKKRSTPLFSDVTQHRFVTNYQSTQHKVPEEWRSFTMLWKPEVTQSEGALGDGTFSKSGRVTNIYKILTRKCHSRTLGTQRQRMIYWFWKILWSCEMQ
jgi:hypothetical protein